MKVFIAADHAGFSLKEKVKQTHSHLQFNDLGTHLSGNTLLKVDYADYASQLATRVNKGEGWGILICGSGQGMCMRANKYQHVRAALCWDVASTKLARKHNDANILCLGARLLPFTLVDQLIQIFFETKFDHQSRHQKRIQKISKNT